LLGAAAPAVAGPKAARATPVKLTFADPDFQWLSQGGGSPHHIWTTGDYWRQTFTNTGLASINRIKLNLVMDDNMLNGGGTGGLDLLVNGTKLGHFTFHQGDTSFVTRAVTIPAITGPDYTVEFSETNTVPFGKGSVSLAINGPSYVLIGSL